MDRLAGLDESVAAALRRVPVEEKAQLELAVRWPGLGGAAGRVAERRVRVVTWDPVGWADDREPGPVVAVEGSGSGYRITLFVGAWTLDSPILGTVAAEITALADSVVRVGGANEVRLISGEWPDLEADGLVPPLLGALRLDAEIPLADIEMVKEWWPIAVETVAMVVAGAFGPLDLDLAPRALSTRPKLAPDCPARSGARYSVPFELDLARPAMCSPHRAEALAVMAQAVRQAEAGNPDSWAVFAHAAADLLPAVHVPYPIRNGLLDVEAGVNVADDDQGLLADQADALLAFVEWAATPDRHRSAMRDLGWRPVDGEAWDQSRFDDFAHHVAHRLGAAGQFPLAARVVDALVKVIPHAAANLHGELATQLAESGRTDEARARLRLALEDPSRDLLTEIFAGEVDEAAGDAADAEARYRAALTTARRAGDAILEHDILWHLIELLQDDDERADEVATLQRERDRVHARSIAPAMRQPPVHLTWRTSAARSGATSPARAVADASSSAATEGRGSSSTRRMTRLASISEIGLDSRWAKSPAGRVACHAGTWRVPVFVPRHFPQSTATSRAAQTARILSPLRTPSRSTSTATETLSTESRLTALRLGMASSPGFRTTSLARPRTVVVHERQERAAAGDGSVAGEHHDRTATTLGEL